MKLLLAKFPSFMISLIRIIVKFDNVKFGGIALFLPKIYGKRLGLFVLRKDTDKVEYETFFTL
jgi:hypothetical protein